MAKSYKQMYEELKLSELEILALKAVAHGCNTNLFLRSRHFNGVYYVDALKTVYALIARLTPDDSK